MKRDYVSSRQRINITLPQTTLRLLNRAAPKGSRSYFIDQAVRSLVKERARAELKTKLKEGAIKRAARDLLLAEEGLILDEEAWERGGR